MHDLLLLFFTFFCLLGLIAVEAFHDGLVNFFNYVFFENTFHFHEVILVVLTELDCLFVGFIWAVAIRLTFGLSLNLAVDREV